MPNRNLWFGTGIHLALSEWYGKGTERLVHPLETWEAYCTGEMHNMRVYFDRGDSIESEWVEAVELGKAMLTAYLEEYGEDEQWDFIATERSGQVRVPAIDGSSMVLYAYTYDGVYRDLDDGAIKLLETKTAAAISTAHLTLDDQAGSYWATASLELRKSGTLGPKERIAGVNYNFLRKAMPDDRPRHPRTGEYLNKPTKEHYLSALDEELPDEYRQGSLAKMKVDDLRELALVHNIAVYGEVSRTQPSANLLRHFVQRTRYERNQQIRRIAGESMHMDLLRNGTLPLTKTPRSTGHDACQHGCEFFTMCELHEAGSDWEQFRDSMFHKRDPYADHRKSAHAAS